ncbi:hypothetical protein D3C78_1166370 [compost metagenome]
MNRASPVDMRAALEAAHTMVKAGILFVPMPIMGVADHAALQAEMINRLNRLEQQAEEPQA